jgi:uncharacterized membrane protein YbhN (UPF0104 family)
MSEEATSAETTATGSTPTKRKIGPKQIISFIAGLVIVVGIFAFAIPRFADYGAVWKAFDSLTWLELVTLIAATVFNLFTYWLANQAALIGLTLPKSAVTTQTATSVANTLPAGGAIAIGVTYAQLASWGFTAAEIALFVGVTGIWNIFVKLGLPVVALALLAVTGQSDPALVSAAVIGVVILVAAVVLLALVFKSEHAAISVGNALGRAASAVLKPFGKGPVTDVGDRTVRFRRETLILVRRRWLRLSWTTVLSNLALYFVLLLCLRHMGISEQDVSALEVLAVFSFGRLLTTIPITPGGAGVIELGYIGGLTTFADGEKAAIVAAVLLFRVLTFGIQIPIGGFTYLYWRWKKSWFRDSPPPGSIADELARTMA